MGVGTYALVDSDTAFVYLGSPSANGFAIFCNASGATAATVEVTDTTMILIITGGGSAGTTTITLAAAANDILSELITTINAVSGWKARALYYGAASSTDLVVTGAVSCLTSANEATFQINRIYESDKWVDRATDIIERWANRKFKTRAYDREVYDGSGYTNLILNQYPVTRLGRVSIGRTNGFSITNASATNFCTIEISKTLIRLNVDGTVTDLTIGLYATITAVITAINALGAGWVVTSLSTDNGTKKPWYISLDGVSKMPELIQCGAQSCKSPELAYIEIYDDDLNGYLITGVGDEDRNPGTIYYSGGFSAGHQNIFVDYTAGYTTIPAALEDLCLALVKMKYDRSKLDLNVKSESLGDYSYTLGDLKQVDSDILEAASSFKRILL